MIYSNLIKKALFAFLGLSFPFINLYRNIFWKGLDNSFLLSFDVDYTKDEAAIPEILNILKKNNIFASFACIGMRVKNNPSLYKMILDEGHEIFNHSYSHPSNSELCPNRTWGQLSNNEKNDEIIKTQEIIYNTINRYPVGFRLPHFGNIQTENTDILYEMLKNNNIIYSSSVLDFNMEGKILKFIKPFNIYEIGITTCPFHPFTAMDSYHIKRSHRYIYKIIHNYFNLEQTLSLAEKLSMQRNNTINIYLDPLDVTNNILDNILSPIKNRDFYTYSEYIKKCLIFTKK
jgi:hypothetical protein